MFPITNKDKLVKLRKIKSSLLKFRDKTLQEVIDSDGMREEVPKGVLEQIKEQIAVAIKKYETTEQWCTVSSKVSGLGKWISVKLNTQALIRCLDFTQIR